MPEMLLRESPGKMKSLSKWQFALWVISSHCSKAANFHMSRGKALTLLKSLLYFSQE